MAGEVTPGRRVLPNLIWGEDPRGDFKLGPGEYIKVEGCPAVPWMGNDPIDGGVFTIGNRHTVVEHEDGTITVSPSLYDTSPGGWHGWLERGSWRSV